MVSYLRIHNHLRGASENFAHLQALFVVQTSFFLLFTHQSKKKERITLRLCQKQNNGHNPRAMSVVIDYQCFLQETLIVLQPYTSSLRHFQYLSARDTYLRGVARCLYVFLHFLAHLKLPQRLWNSITRIPLAIRHS